MVDIIDKADAGDEIEFFEGLITPGFINAHCHTELSYLKGVITPNTGLVQFVQQVMKNRGLLNEVKMQAMLLAERKCITAAQWLWEIFAIRQTLFN